MILTDQQRAALVERLRRDYQAAARAGPKAVAFGPLLAVEFGQQFGRPAEVCGLTVQLPGGGSAHFPVRPDTRLRLAGPGLFVSRRVLAEELTGRAGHLPAGGSVWVKCEAADPPTGPELSVTIHHFRPGYAPGVNEAGYLTAEAAERLAVESVERPADETRLDLGGMIASTRVVSGRPREADFLRPLDKTAPEGIITPVAMARNGETYHPDAIDYTSLMPLPAPVPWSLYSATGGEYLSAGRVGPPEAEDEVTRGIHPGLTLIPPIPDDDGCDGPFVVPAG